MFFYSTAKNKEEKLSEKTDENLIDAAVSRGETFLDMIKDF